MAQSTAVKEAADRLLKVLKTLEIALDPLVARVTTLERELANTKSFENDRSRLASELDAAAAREAEYKQREQEFSRLANETTAELDNVIAQVQRTLGEGSADG